MTVRFARFLTVFILLFLGCATDFRSTRLSGTLDGRFESLYTPTTVPLVAGVNVSKDVQRYILEGQAKIKRVEENAELPGPIYRYALGEAVASMFVPASRIAFNHVVEVNGIDDALGEGCAGLLTVNIEPSVLEILYFERKSLTAPAGEGKEGEGYAIASIKGESRIALKLTFFDRGHRPIWQETVQGEAFETYPSDAAQHPDLFRGIVEESLQEAMKAAVIALRSSQTLYNYGREK